MRSSLRWVVVLSALLGCAGQTLAEEEHTICGRSVDGWIKILRDKTSRNRWSALLYLGYFGPEAKDAVPDLIQILRDGHGGPQVSDPSVALGRIGPEAAPAVPLLIELFLKQGCQHLTGMGAFGHIANVETALVRIGRPAVPALVDVLKGPDRDMRVCAAKALGDLGPAAEAAVPALIAALRPDVPDFDELVDETLRIHALIALGKIGPGAGAAIPPLNVLLGWALKVDEGLWDAEPRIVQALDRIGEAPALKLVEAYLRGEESGRIYELARLGTRARVAAPRLRPKLTDPSPRIRTEAAFILIAIDPPAPDAVRVMVAAMDPIQDDAYLAPEALGRLGPAAESALPALIALVRSGPGHEEEIEALVQIDPEGKVCLPALISALERDDPTEVSVAAKSLGLLGPRAKSAIPALAKTLARRLPVQFGDVEYPIAEAVKALGRIGREAVPPIPALIECVRFRHDRPAQAGLSEEEIESRYAAAAASARVLGSFGPEARAAVPALMEALRADIKDDPNQDVLREAALALGKIGDDAKVAVPLLRTIAKDAPPGPPRSLSDTALVALLTLAPESRGPTQALAERSQSPFQKAYLLGALGRSSFEGDALTRIALEALELNFSPDVEEGTETLYTEGYFENVGLYGAGGRVAIPRLEELRRHPNPWIRQWAGETLEKISGSKPAPPRPSPQTGN